MEGLFLHTDVVKYIMTAEELPDMLSGVRKCTCRYWQNRELFTRMTMPFEGVHATLQNGILRVDFSTRNDPCALSITGAAKTVYAETDGEFFDISILFLDDTEVHIFLHKL